MFGEGKMILLEMVKLSKSSFPKSRPEPFCRFMFGLTFAVISPSIRKKSRLGQGGDKNTAVVNLKCRWWKDCVFAIWAHNR